MGNSCGTRFGTALCVRLPLAISRLQLTQTPGHCRLWVDGIHHGDVSFDNLMYSISATGKPEGVLSDCDLASWNEFPTTNSDRTGTVPFMALNRKTTLQYPR